MSITYMTRQHWNEWHLDRHRSISEPTAECDVCGRSITIGKVGGFVPSVADKPTELICDTCIEGQPEECRVPEEQAAPERLTMADALALGDIVQWSYTCAKVGWMRNGVQDFGQVRSIGDQQGGFASKEQDVRDCFVRITTRGGWELFEPVRSVIEMRKRGEMVAYDW